MTGRSASGWVCTFFAARKWPVTARRAAGCNTMPQEGAARDPTFRATCAAHSSESARSTCSDSRATASPPSRCAKPQRRDRKTRRALLTLFRRDEIGRQRRAFAEEILLELIHPDLLPLRRHQF